MNNTEAKIMLKRWFTQSLQHRGIKMKDAINEARVYNSLLSKIEDGFPESNAFERESELKWIGKAAAE